MRILLLSSLFWPHQGGAERQARALATALRRRGIEVLVLTGAVAGELRTAEVDGIPVYRWISGVPFGPLWGLTYMGSTLWALFRLRRRYDLIHCQQLYLHTPVAVLCQRWLRKPVCVRLACTGSYGDVQVLRGMRGGKCLLRVSRRSRAFIALSRAGTAEAADVGVPAHRIALVPNAVLLECGGLACPEREREILFVGALRKQKGLDCLLQAFARLKGDDHLVLVGTGPERYALKDLARSLRICDRVRFVGRVEDPSPYYRRARLFVLPSLSEGISNALLEAMAFGTAVVATSIGGNVDLVEDGVTGLLVQPGDSEQMAAAIARLLGDESLARLLGAKARQRVLHRHTLEAMVDGYLAVYRTVLLGAGHSDGSSSRAAGAESGVHAPSRSQSATHPASGTRAGD